MTTHRGFAGLLLLLLLSLLGCRASTGTSTPPVATKQTQPADELPGPGWESTAEALTPAEPMEPVAEVVPPAEEAVASADHRPIRLAWITNGVATYWSIAADGARTAARDLVVELLIAMPDTVGGQQAVIETLVAGGVDGIAVSLIDPEGMREMIEQAARSTTVIVHDHGFAGDDVLAFVGIDNYAAGRQAGRLVKEALPQGGELMLFVGHLTAEAELQRAGLVDELLGRERGDTRPDPSNGRYAGERYTVLGTSVDGFDRLGAVKLAVEAAQSLPDLDAMVGLFAYNPPACLEALKQTGQLGAIEVIGFDEAEETLQGIRDGHVHGTVVQQPWVMGHETVRVLASLVRGDVVDLPPGGFVEIPTIVVRRDNLDEYWADLKLRIERARE